MLQQSLYHSLLALSLHVLRAVLKNWSTQMQVSLPIVVQVVRIVEDKALGVKVLQGMRQDQLSSWWSKLTPHSLIMQGSVLNVFGHVQVSLPIVRQFVKSVEEKALGVKVLKGVRPDQQLVKVVNDQLVELMGGQQEDLNDPKDGPQVCKICLSSSQTMH